MICGSLISLIRRVSPGVLLIIAWLAVYLPSGLIGHFSLRTNAFDLSVFDYALWSLRSGELGTVPFMGQSLFSHHFMPSLGVVLIPYAVWPSPVCLIVVQTVVMAGAGFLVWRLARASVPSGLAFALLGAFLFSRPSHSAVTSYFYVESLEPLLVFALVCSLHRQRLTAYWLLVFALLGCKEDTALYLLCYGALLALTHKRRLGLATCAIAAIWCAVAVGVAIPAARRADGLSTRNPFLEDRYASAASPDITASALSRVMSVRTLNTVAKVSGSVAGICWLGPGYLAVAGPGLAMNLAARPDSQRAGLVGHYLWPVLPWLYLAAVSGARRAWRWRPAAGWALAGVLVVITVGNTPLWLRFSRPLAVGWSEARSVRAQLGALPSTASVLAMPNLIPHIGHRSRVWALGMEPLLESDPDFVVISEIGDLWPLTAEQVQHAVAGYRADVRYETISAGPLHVFRRRGRQPLPSRPQGAF